MSTISQNRITISKCLYGALLRWYYNGWNYYLFSNRYTTEIQSNIKSVQAIEVFSPISRIERITGSQQYNYVSIGADTVSPGSIAVFKGLLLSESVQILIGGVFEPFEIDRGKFTIKPNSVNGYQIFLRGKIGENAARDLSVYDPNPVENTSTPSKQFIDHFTSFAGSLPYGQYPIVWTPVYGAGSYSSTEYLSHESGTKLKLNSLGSGGYKLSGCWVELPDGYFGNLVLELAVEYSLGLYVKTFGAGWTSELVHVNGVYIGTIATFSFSVTQANQVKYIYIYNTITGLDDYSLIDYVKLSKYD